MDTGIRILNSYAAGSWSLLVLIGLGLLIVGALVWAVLEAEAGFILLTFPLIMLMTVVGVTCPPTYTAHECLIADNIAYTAITEHYDVIEQRGEIWVLRERVVEAEEEGK